MNLTLRQRQILEFVQNYIDARQVAPTVNEIRDHFKLGSLATVHKHLKALESRGWIRRGFNQARAIQMIPVSNSTGMDIPLLGLIAAGQPITALETPDVLSIPEDMMGHQETFALKVTGNSMVNDGIHDGDFIIVESRPHAQDGEIVVALIDGQDATVKRFYREGGIIRLQPSNDQMDAIFVEANRVLIRGVVIGLIRKYRH